MTPNFGATRDLLVAKLGQVGELEHATCCTYLFAAASIKLRATEGSCTWDQVEQARGWKTTLLSIARQEMEHLAIVSNLLTAIGEAPWYHHPDFPVSAREYPNHVDLRLTTFDRSCEPIPPDRVAGGRRRRTASQTASRVIDAAGGSGSVAAPRHRARPEPPS